MSHATSQDNTLIEPTIPGQEILLHGAQIAFSVSESDDLEHLKLSGKDLDTTVEKMAVGLISAGATIAYAGDLRTTGFTELLARIADKWKIPGTKNYRFINYFTQPDIKLVTADQLTDFLLKHVNMKVLKMPPHLAKRELSKKGVSNITDDKYLLAECYMDMRMQITANTYARVMLGGRLNNYAGYQPGLIEEAYCSIQMRKPLFLLGGFGGSAAAIVKMLTGEEVKELKHADTGAFKPEIIPTSPIPLDHDGISAFFHAHGVKGISDHNGLSPEENETLFKSADPDVLLGLVLKGLKTLSDKKTQTEY